MIMEKQCFREKFTSKLVIYRVAIVTLMLSGLVGMASAWGVWNDSIGPILVGVTLLFTPLLAVILAAIPVIIAIAIIAFIIGILAAILDKVKV
jgi:hypothetical protein